MVRRIAIGIAIFLRIALLFILLETIKYFQDPLFAIKNSIFSGSFNFHSIIVLLGGIFLIFTAIKEIRHMLNLNNVLHTHEGQKSQFIKSLLGLQL